MFYQKHRGDLVGDGGFEPPKALPADLQSVPFGHSGNPPYIIFATCGAGGRIRTPDLLITNQLLYQLSYTSISATRVIISHHKSFVNLFFKFIKNFFPSSLSKLFRFFFSFFFICVILFREVKKN